MLGFWSWSLVQFVLVVTGTTKARTKMTEIFGSQGGSPVMVSLSGPRISSFFRIKDENQLRNVYVCGLNGSKNGTG